MARDFYEVLGVAEDATQEEIQSAYREKVKEYHPDVSDRDDATERFQEVKRAEEILSDEGERSTYDRLGHETYVRYYEEGAAEGAADPDPGSGAGTGAGSAPGGTGVNAGTTGAGGRSRTAGTGPGPGGVGGFDFDAAAAAAAGFDTGSSDGGTTTGSGGGSGNTAGPDPDFDFGAASSSVGFGTAASRQSGAGTVNAGEDRWSTDAYTPGGVDNDDEGGSTYAVHDWTDSGATGSPTVTLDLDQESMVIALSMVVIYPCLVFTSVTPTLPLFFNAVIATLTLLIVGYTLTEPKVAIVSFGILSVFAPLAALAAGLDALFSALVVATCWVPFGYAVVVALVARPS